MTAYIMRRLLLVIPTLFGIMVINFALTQFVPGGPIEQIIANYEGNGDVFEGIAGGGKEVAQNFEQDEKYTGARGLPPEFIAELEKEFGFKKCIGFQYNNELLNICKDTHLSLIHI